MSKPAGHFLAALVLVSGLATSAPAADSATGPIAGVKVAVSPLVLRGPDGERAVLNATLQSGALSNLTAHVLGEGLKEAPAMALGGLPAGTNRVRFEVPMFAVPAKVRVRFNSIAGEQEFGPFDVPPPRHWTIYLTQHTHTDIGYTRPQTEILPEHLRYLDYALDFCDLTDGYPDDAKFRWTCETAWAVREYLKRRPPAQLERLKQRVRDGRLEVTAMLLNMAEIATESSLAASLQPVASFQQEFGAPMRTAMQDDVNGAAWCLVESVRPGRCAVLRLFHRQLAALHDRLRGGQGLE